MYEQNNTQLETNFKRTCAPAKCRSAKWPNAERPVASLCTHDGQRMENPSQSATGKGKCEGCAQANMERVCTSRGRHPVEKENPGPKEPMVSLGDATNERRVSVHPERQTDLVEIQKPTGRVNTNNVLHLLECQKYQCALTGRKLTPQTAALDHIVPIRCDGAHVIENTQVLHKDVNRAKGSLTNSEFIQLCQEIVLWPKIATSNEESK